MTLTSLEIIQMNSTQSQRKKKKNLPLFTFNRHVFFSPPDLKALYLTTFFSFRTYIFAYNTVFFSLSAFEDRLIFQS